MGSSDNLLDSVVTLGALRPFEHLRVRSNPDLEVLGRDGLSPDERARLDELTDADELAVLLRSRSSGEVTKVIDHETRLLLHTLREPKSIDQAAPAVSKVERNLTIARLVCDGLLQLSDGDEHYVHGAAAYRLLFNPTQGATAKPQSHVSALSNMALAYAAALACDDEGALARRLYRYNSLPHSRKWQQRLDRPGQVAAWLGLETPSRWLAALGDSYEEHGSRLGDRPWVQWFLRRPASMRHQRCKLYVSPHTEVLPEAFGKVVQLCADMAVPSFKIGVTAAEVLRADKLVLYFDSEEAIYPVAREILSALKGLPAQGVPFTAPLDRDGMVSWGIDPRPHSPGELPEEMSSFRWFVVDRLAKAMASAKQQGCADVATTYALQRLRLEGIDVDGFRPPANWRPA